MGVIGLFVGVLLALASAPTDAWPLAVVGLAILYRRNLEVGYQQRFLRSFVAFGAMFAINLFWVRQFSFPGYVVLAFVEAAVLAAFVALTPRFQSWARTLAFPALLTLGELVRTYFPWGGIPLGTFTTGTANSVMAPGATVIGEIGLFFLIALSAVAVASLTQRERRWKYLVVPAILIPIIGANVPIATGQEVAVADVQGGGPLGLKVAAQQPTAVFNRQLEATRQAGNADLIVWPENVITVNAPIDQDPVGEVVGRIAQERNSYIVAGVVEREGKSFRNAAVVWNPEGKIVSRYEKELRVPFGEYVPYRDFFSKLGDVEQVPRDAIKGNGPASLQIGDVTYAVSISYEGMFSRRALDGVRNGGEALLIPTNASSYKSPKVTSIQVRAAQLRARETGRYVVLSAPTGRSAIIDNRGTVLAVSAISEQAVLENVIKLSDTTTPYVRIGDLPLAMVCLLMLVSATVIDWRNRSNLSARG